MLQITAFYAALLAVLFIYLSVRVIGWRRERRVEFGHGEDFELLRRMRVHANFAEYVPFALLLMALAESMAPPDLVVHLAGRAADRRALVARVRHLSVAADHALPRLRHGADLRRHRDRRARLPSAFDVFPRCLTWRHHLRCVRTARAVRWCT